MNYELGKQGIVIRSDHIAATVTRIDADVRTRPGA